MKKNIILSGIVMILILSSCASNKKSLYSWGNYDAVSYNYIKDETDKSLNSLLETYNNLMENQKGLRKAIPPGMCADYGYFLYKKGEKTKALEMLKKEVQLYPESGTFVNRIIKKIEE